MKKLIIILIILLVTFTVFKALFIAYEMHSMNSNVGKTQVNRVERTK